MEMPKNFLTEEEKKYPYAKFFEVPYENMNPANPLYGITAKPMDPAKALTFDKKDLLLDPAYDADDMGYCVLPDGTGYVGMRMFYPNCTKEMFEWWFAWHGLESSRYKIWDPKSHYGVAVSRRSLAQRTDPKLNWKERNWDTSDFITAWTVNGVQTTRIAFVSPKEFGFDTALMEKHQASAVCCFSSHPDERMPVGPSTRVLHEVEGGLKVSLYFWYGFAVVDGKAIKPADYRCPMSIPELQVVHCAEEYQHLGEILPAVYAENHLRVDKPEDFKTMPF